MKKKFIVTFEDDLRPDDIGAAVRAIGMIRGVDETERAADNVEAQPSTAHNKPSNEICALWQHESTCAVHPEYVDCGDKPCINKRRKLSHVG